MNAMLDISSVSQGLAPAEAPVTIPGKTRSETAVAGTLSLTIRLLRSYAVAVLQAAAGVFVVLYSLGAVAISAGLLFCTFNR